MNKKRILILGSSLMQVPVLQTARCMGYYVITADANASAVGRDYAHEFWHVDLQNSIELVRRAKSAKLHAVLTCATDFSYVVSLIAQSCGLRGIAPSVARRANFKNAMRACFVQHGVASPPYELFDCSGIFSDESFDACSGTFHDGHCESQKFSALFKIFHEQVLRHLGLPLVVKPVDNMGARGVSLVEHAEGLFVAVQSALKHSRSRMVIAEKKLSGPELSVDSFVINGELFPIGTADRHIVFSPYFVESGHSIASELPQHLQKDAWQALAHAARALGIDNGVCKGDIIFHAGKAYIGECAARLSGGYMSGWTIPYAYGIDLEQYVLMLALHGTLSYQTRETLRTVISTCAVAERALFTLPGNFKCIRIPQYLHDMPALPQGRGEAASFDQNLQGTLGVRNVIITASAGRYYGLPKNNTDKVGSVIATGATSNEANAAAAAALSRIYCEVEPNDEANTFLYASATNDEQIYPTWYCYRETHSAFHEACAQTMTTLLENAQRCRQELCMRVYLPHTLRDSEERGAWTHLMPREALELALVHMPICLVERLEESINAIALRAFLRAGWQGLHYTLQLLQICTQNALKSVCALALQ